MNIAIDDTLKFAITLVSILNPLGALPVFLELTKKHSKDQVRVINNSCTVAVGTTILVSLLFGQKILNFFGISIPSFTIGGGILIFSMAFHMIQAKNSNVKINDEEMVMDPQEIGIVPLAIPLLSGPGVISSSIIYSKHMDSSYHWIFAILLIILISIAIKIILTYGKTIGQKLGRTGLSVMTRIMGIILMATSIEMIVFGVKEILPILKNV